MTSRAASVREVRRPRRRLFWKYVVVIVALVTTLLVASAGFELWFSYQESRDALVALQREKAAAAAGRIEAFIREIERQMGWTTLPLLTSGAAALEQRRIDFVRLQRQVPAITDLAYVDPEGREQLRVSRLAMDVVGSDLDLSADPRFTEAIARRIYQGPVYFRKESEPYMVVAMAQTGGGVTVAEVNLKFIWDVVTQIKIGKAGRAYVIDEAGNLIAHPDISLVLQKTSLAALPQVREALVQGGTAAPLARDVQGRRVLTASATIPGLRWTVFAEQPLEEAFAPLEASLKRALALHAHGVGLAIGARLVHARRMVRPIQALQAGAARIGGGELGHRIVVRTGDELQALATEFNRMTATLQESYATLEQRVEERTRELSESLEQQTATAEILRVINAAQVDLHPVFEAIAASAARLCDGVTGGVFLVEDGQVRPAAHYHVDDEAFAGVFPAPLDSDLLTARSIAARDVVQTPDVLAESDYQHKALAERLGFRSLVSVPMMRDGVPIGSITVTRTQPGRFSDQQVALLQTFADQAVIAIENARLLQEVQARNAALTEALEQQTATSEILRSISGATMDAQPVFETIVRNAVTLCEGRYGAVYRWDGQRVHVVAYANIQERLADWLDQFPRELRPPDQPDLLRLVIESGELVRVDDAVGDPRVPAAGVARRAGIRSMLFVPMRRDDTVLGVIAVNHSTPAAFTEARVELLRTFADQAVIAIENVRLFTELDERTSQLEVASRHKDEFLANMSHELRTPLNAIIGFSEVMLERMFGELTDKQEEYLNDILSSGRHLLSLINDILDLSKIEAGRMELDLTDFDLPAAIDNALTLVHERAARRGLVLEQDVDPALGKFQGDERKIKQVLLNLLSNAIKFTPEGGRVTVRGALRGDVVEIAVSDTGVGIAPEDQEAVFEEFRQVGTDTARKHEGTGLGLALARRFVELHGGNIWLESEVRVGSTFTFALPVRR